VFADAILQDADLRWARLRGADFSAARLDGASFVSADGPGARFDRADARNTSFDCAKLRAATFHGTKFGPATTFNSSELQGADFTGSHGVQEADFASAEIDDTTTPWEAGLNWTIKMAKGDFVGRSALEAAVSRGAERSLVGFEVSGRGIARQGHGVVLGGEEVGRVTSGTFSPTFKKALGLAYVPKALSEPGQSLTLSVRGKELAAHVIETPFYRRSK